MTAQADRDVVYIVKASESNEELRHSLRSVAENLPHRRIWLVGYRPRWIDPTDVGYVPTMQRGPKHANTWANWIAAARHPEISDEFVLFNDDFFVMEPLADVPVLHRGPLAEMIDWYRVKRLTSHTQRASYTRQMLQRGGHSGTPMSYELHVPMVVNRHILAAGADWLRTNSTSGSTVAKRTFYGNLARVGGQRCPDLKVMNAADPLPQLPEGVPFLSTSPDSWRGNAGGWVRRCFPEPGPHERVLSGQQLYRPPGRGSAGVQR